MTTTIPHLVDTEWSKQIVVKGKPLLIRAGELQNSSLSGPDYMDTVWQKMVDTNVNTLLGSVSWEMIEPEEGTFDFSVLDEVILGARKHNLHLVLLWFGSFKNGMRPHPWCEDISANQAKEFPHTSLDGSRQTPSGSRAQNSAKRAACSRRAMSSPSSNRRPARPTPKPSVNS